jgi:hypothetical protein
MLPTWKASALADRPPTVVPSVAVCSCGSTGMALLPWSSYRKSE